LRYEMADLLTHVLVAYVVVTVVRWRVGGPRHWVPIAMGGAAMPDLVKLRLVIDEPVVQGVLGAPFEYAPISSLGGVVVVAAGITVLFDREVWRCVYGFLVFGSLTSLAVDGLRTFANGAASFWLYPVWVRPATPELYVSSNPRVSSIIVAATVVVAVVDRAHGATDENPER
jgi:hypothetical protein